MLFDIDIEVGGERLTVQNVDVKDDGTFSTCACNGDAQKRVDGVWTPTYLILSVGDGTVGACSDTSACKTDQEISKGQMYIFEQWADDVMLNDRHANFDTASGVMKFAFTGDGNDTVEFVDAQGTTTVKFKTHEEVKPAGDGGTTDAPTTDVREVENGAKTPVEEEKPEEVKEVAPAPATEKRPEESATGEYVRGDNGTAVVSTPTGVYGDNKW
ncbi:hypothetical protein DOS86_01190 [Anaplasma marginale]|uniref:hypothetical protein n=1 Tax=Anaplasma marginale TaxID=770 RepID=UPI000DEF48AA|nr:hypothetical protein [Anaplasma marginale]RCL20039.1 hypothetical protein DOS86_01190 [Anaplasma marginale]